MVRSMLEEEDAEKKLFRLPTRRLQGSGGAIGTHVFARCPQQDMRSKSASNRFLHILQCIESMIVSLRPLGKCRC